MLTEAFMQRALFAALILGPLCGLLGVFVTARRMAFFSDTVAHSALAGVAAGFLIGFQEPTLPVLLFCSLVALAMLWLQEKTDLLNDTILAVLLSASVALGVLLLSLQPRRWAELDKYLFGDILSVGWNDIRFAAILATAVAIAIFAKLNDLTLLSSHPDLAHVCGIPVRRLNYAFVLLLTITVALSIRLLGIILVTSLIVVPPATARNLAHNLRQQLLLSIGLGWVGAGAGVLLSYPLNLPCGPSITLTLTALFLISIICARLRRDKATQSHPIVTPNP